MIKTRTWIIVIAAVALVAGALSLWLFSARTGTVVEIVQDGTVIEEIDLLRVREAYRFTVTSSDGGENVVLVQPGRVCVESADCPDKICVQRGWLTDEPTPIVCLPHRLVIRSKSASGADAATQ
ncbi:MAG: NusG domain II-containing protein [Oscillospiraceae bacterium]|nr:NusG domain II-containing protein [Oscillospiraceae bacterium]